jgi:hypothetical protein
MSEIPFAEMDVDTLWNIGCIVIKEPTTPLLPDELRYKAWSALEFLLFKKQEWSLVQLLQLQRLLQQEPNLIPKVHSLVSAVIDTKVRMLTMGAKNIPV